MGIGNIFKIDDLIPGDFLSTYLMHVFIVY